MSGAELRTGLIGCGRVSGWVHLPLLSALPGARLTAVAEASPERTAEMRSQASAAEWIADYRDLLARPDIDAVVIALPTGMHAEAAIAAIRARKHIYLEKPVAGDRDGAAALRAVWESEGGGLAGSVGFNYRFNPLYVDFKQALNSGAIGKVVSLRSSFSTPLREVPDWKKSRAAGGGVLLDMASHHADLAAFFLGTRIRRVSAHVHSRHGEGDTASVTFEMEDGVQVQSFLAMGCVEEDRWEAYGENGKAWVDRYLSTQVRVEGPTEAHSRFGRLVKGAMTAKSAPYLLRKIKEPLSEPSFRASLEHWVDCIRAGRRPSPGFAEGFTSLNVILAAEEAAGTGRMVDVDP